MTPYDFGEIKLVEDTRKIVIGDLLKQVRTQAKEFLVSNQAVILGTRINLCFSKTGFGGSRIWFTCPTCLRRIGVLYSNQGLVGCRICLGLRYRKCRYKGMVEEEI